MALVDCNDPIFDRKVNQILQMIEEGKEKTDIAEKLGYQSPLSIDNYMRRRNFSWDSREKNFVPAAERYSAKGRDNVMPLRGVSKAEVIISLFDQGESNVKEIAKQVGFETNKELAKFMKGKGYEWDPVSRNYVESNNILLTPDTISSQLPINSQNPSLNEILQNIIPFLQGINNKPQSEIVVQQNIDEPQKVPRYKVVGQYTTKGMRMAIAIDELTRRFSSERNLSQREILEVALIEFFKKYGYSSEIDRCLDK